MKIIEIVSFSLIIFWTLVILSLLIILFKLKKYDYIGYKKIKKYIKLSVGFIVVVSVIFFELILYFESSKGEPIGFIFILALGIAIYYIIIYVTFKDEDRRRVWLSQLIKIEDDKKANEAYLSTIRIEYIDKFRSICKKYNGNCDYDLFIGNETSPYKQYMTHNHIYVFEKESTILIYDIEYNFKDILGFTIVDNVENETVTLTNGKNSASTGDLIGRSIIGGVLAGEIGALVGALSSKQNVSMGSTSYTTTNHEYIIHINVNNIKNPIIKINFGSQQDKVQQIAGILNVIIAKCKSE